MSATLDAVMDLALISISISWNAEDFQAKDLLQEHHNLSLKRVFNGQQSHFDSKFLREAVSLNIILLAQLSNSIWEKFGIQAAHSSHSDADISSDINFLCQAYLNNAHHLYTLGWTQSYLSIDAIAHGVSKLQGGTLQGFLEKHVDSP